MSAVRCPICGRRFEPDQAPAMPFCSERCRRVDLGRWLEEQYGLPSEPEEEEEEEEEDEPPESTDSGPC